VEIDFILRFFQIADCEAELREAHQGATSGLIMASCTTQGHFPERTRDAKKVMVLDLGFLGDTVQTLPALWLVRQAYPDAELHFAVEQNVTSLLECASWVDRVWGYPRFPKHATLRQNLAMVARLRREKFDVLINLNGSDRSSWLTFFSGAGERLGRLPRDGGPIFWRQMFTEIVEHSSLAEPSYVQKCHCLEKAGFPFTRAEFHVETKPVHLQAAGIIPEDAGTYFHLSPFTTADNKELPPEQLLELIGKLESRFPGKRLVLSSAPTEREGKKMEKLLAGLTRKPWKVFAGELTLVQLAAVIQHCALHLCGDTGTLHLALMTGAAAVSWFRPNPGMRMWIPVGGQYRTIAGTSSPEEKYLNGIQTAELVESVFSVLENLRGKVVP